MKITILDKQSFNEAISYGEIKVDEYNRIIVPEKYKVQFNNQINFLEIKFIEIKFNNNHIYQASFIEKVGGMEFTVAIADIEGFIVIHSNEVGGSGIILF